MMLKSPSNFIIVIVLTLVVILASQQLVDAKDGVKTPNEQQQDNEQQRRRSQARISPMSQVGLLLRQRSSNQPPTPMPVDYPLTPMPTDPPTPMPTNAPTPRPTNAPTPTPTNAPTPTPTNAPTPTPTDPPTTDAPVLAETVDALCVDDPTRFNICLDIDPIVTEEDAAIFLAAKQRWDRIVTQDLPMDRLSRFGNVESVVRNACRYEPSFASFDFDDVGICMSVLPPPPGFEFALGLAIQLTRRTDGTASFGAITFFDNEPLAQLRADDSLIVTALHEMGKQPLLFLDYNNQPN